MSFFIKRKPVVQVELVPEEQEQEKEKEKETRRRNRLSKPLTNSRINTIASTTNLQETGTRSQNTSTSDLVPSGPLSSHPSNPALRHQIRSEVFDSDRLSPIDALKSTSALSLAQIIKQTDKNVVEPEASQEPSIPANKPKKRKSLILRRLSAQNSAILSRSASKERISSPKSDSAASSPNSSLDRVVDSPSIPPTRRASFTPGAATRKPSPMRVNKDVEKKQDTIEEAEEKSVVGSEYFDWQPRPPVMTGRAGTPADLSYSHLVGFRIGSLQVTNGRASPAFSEMSKVSKHLLTVPKLHRDVSSEYGDVEEDVREADVVKEAAPDPLIEDVTDIHRSFSWEVNEDKYLEEPSFQEEMDMRTKIPLDMDDDQASLMAKEYMAELPETPFSLAKSGSVRRMISNGSLQKSPSFLSLQRTPSPDPLRAKDRSSSIDSSKSTLSTSGSVIRKSTSHLAVKTFNIGGNAAEEDDQRRNSLMSWYSPVEPSFNQDEAFQSALEFQVHKPGPQPQPQSSLDKSDSGYSSAYSVRSLRTSKVISAVVEYHPPADLPAILLNATPQEAEVQTMSSELQYRPSILKTRKTEPGVPTFANLRPAIISLNSVSAVSPSALPSIKPVKQRKKLQKKRTQSQPPDKIAITRVRSFELDAIPAIPSDVKENLRIRTEEVPELEQTYNKLHAQASSSNMNLPIREIRFPSPEPQHSTKVGRPRSISRPRSWISRPKENTSKSRRNSDLSQADALAIISNFGNFGSPLGSSPYDFSHENLGVNRSKGASKRPSHAPRSKSMMNDKTAAEVAKFRRRSFQQRDALSERRSSFNDRGGIPGKSLRPASLIGDVPPITQEMLQTVYRTSSLQRQASMTNNVVAPPPPPPPPPHSPRPADITPDPWAAQAAAWKARRQSVGAALSKHSRGSTNFDGAMQQPVEPLYPAPPSFAEPVRMGWPQYTTSPEEYFPSHSERYDAYQPKAHANQSSHDRPRGRERYRDADGQTGQNYQQYQRDVYSADHGPPVHPQSFVQRRALPEPPVAENKYLSSTPSHAANNRRRASSHIEELHQRSSERPSQSSESGRYYDGRNHSYERGDGYGSVSDGTRLGARKHEATRRDISLKAGYGFKLRNVPVLSMVRV